jgi:hypothetical protein
MTGKNREIENPKVPIGLPDAESKPKRDDEKGGRPTIEIGNRDRGPAKPHEIDRG